jgi:hypothetical protein
MCYYLNMNEKFGGKKDDKLPERPETPEERDKRGQEMFRAYENNNPELPVEKIAYSPELAELMNVLFDEFETRFPLDQLINITTAEEAQESILREDAKHLLSIIYNHIKIITQGTNISDEDRLALESRRKKLSLAVGIINAGIVRHE